MVYNRSSNEDGLGISEILEPLHTTLTELIDKDRQGKSHLIEYTDRDIVAAALLFAHITGNRLIHNLTKQEASIPLTQHLASTYGGMIREITKAMTGIDVDVFNNGKGQG